MNKYLCFLSLIWHLLWQNFLYSQANKTISVEFTRTTTKETNVDIVKGNIYFQEAMGIVIKVSEPINQWFVFRDSTMIIYYPNEQKALRFNYKNPLSLPFYQTFILNSINDLIFSKAGFKLARHEVKADTLLSYWTPPKNLRKMMSVVIIGVLKDDKIAKIEVQDAKGQRMAKTTYNNHFRYDGFFIPLEINSIVYHKNDSVVEKIVYTNPQYDITLPPEIVDFKIPNGTKIKEFEW